MAVTVIQAGGFRWIASYSGDPNNNAVSTSCGDAGETSTVNKATPTLTTSATATATAGQTIQDMATLAGGSEEHTSELQSRSELVCRLLLQETYTNGTAAGSAPVAANGTYPSFFF